MKTIHKVALSLGLLISFTSSAYDNPIIDYLEQQFQTYVTPSPEDMKAADPLAFACEVFDADGNSKPRETEITLRPWDAEGIYSLSVVDTYLVYGNVKTPMDVSTFYVKATDRGLYGRKEGKTSSSKIHYYLARVNPQDKKQMLVRITQYQSESRPNKLDRYIRCER